MSNSSPRFRALAITLLLAFGAGPAVRSATPSPATPHATSTATPAALATVLTPTDLAALKAKLGQRVVIEGTIVARGASKSGKTRYLNFSKKWGDAVTLVFLTPRGQEPLPDEKLDQFLQKKVRVTGTVSTYKDDLQIKVETLAQLEVLP
jgi:hypothetical protein